MTTDFHMTDKQRGRIEHLAKQLPGYVVGDDLRDAIDDAFGFYRMWHRAIQTEDITEDNTVDENGRQHRR
jgi:hypothetical protein